MSNFYFTEATTSLLDRSSLFNPTGFLCNLIPYCISKPNSCISNRIQVIAFHKRNKENIIITLSSIRKHGFKKKKEK